MATKTKIRKCHLCSVPVASPKSDYCTDHYTPRPSGNPKNRGLYIFPGGILESLTSAATRQAEWITSHTKQLEGIRRYFKQRGTKLQ